MFDFYFIFSMNFCRKLNVKSCFHILKISYYLKKKLTLMNKIKKSNA